MPCNQTHWGTFRGTSGLIFRQFKLKFGAFLNCLVYHRGSCCIIKREKREKNKKKGGGDKERHGERGMRCRK